MISCLSRIGQNLLPKKKKTSLDCFYEEETTPIYPNPETKTLILPISRKWFDMILNGEKKEEYREANARWNKRVEKFAGDPFKEPPFYTIKFINGYSNNSSCFTIVCESFHTRNTAYHREWGEDLFENKEHHVFNLGTVINKCKC